MSTIIAPPFTDPEQVARKVQLAEDLWNTRDPGKVAAAYTEDTEWKNRAEFLTVAKPSSNSFIVSGTGNLTTGWGRSFGVSAITA
jgi:nuclear transport factor 2 (NTF2) superfamily protein